MSNPENLIKFGKKHKTFLDILAKSFGNITHACKKSGLSRSQYYNWLNRVDGFKNRVEEIQESLMDDAETILHSEIRGGNMTAVIFFLKTKGKKRGYVERQELAGVEDQPVEINVVLGENKHTSKDSD